jgi:hypothetical protein
MGIVYALGTSIYECEIVACRDGTLYVATGQREFSKIGGVDCDEYSNGDDPFITCFQNMSGNYQLRPDKNWFKIQTAFIVMFALSGVIIIGLSLFVTVRRCSLRQPRMPVGLP